LRARRPKRSTRSKHWGGRFRRFELLQQWRREEQLVPFLMGNGDLNSSALKSNRSCSTRLGGTRCTPELLGSIDSELPPRPNREIPTTGRLPLEPGYHNRRAGSSRPQGGNREFPNSTKSGGNLLLPPGGRPGLLGPGGLKIDSREMLSYDG
jgi:hypothetical protein